MNPCGLCVDIGRYPAKRRARLHTGPGAPVIDLLWYRTTITKCVEETIINRREWDHERYIDYPVGEVPQYTPYRDFAKNGDMRPLLDGSHVCHPEWFPTGEPWPTDLPPNEYGADGIPVCCGRGNDPTDAGLAIGVEAGDSHHAAGSAEVGLAIGVEAGDSHHAAGAGEVGLQIGLDVGDVYHAAGSAEVGLQIGLDVGDVYHAAGSAEVGLQIGVDAVNASQHCPPGDAFCYQASPRALNHWCELPSEFARVPQWWRYDVTVGQSYTLQLAFYDGAVVTWEFWQGYSCAAKYMISSGDAHVHFIEITFTASYSHVWWSAVFGEGLLIQGSIRLLVNP